MQERPSDRKVMGASPVVLPADVVTQARTDDREVMGASPVVLSADVVTCVPSENKMTLGTECKHNPTTNPKKQKKRKARWNFLKRKIKHTKKYGHGRVHVDIKQTQTQKEKKRDPAIG